MPSRQDRWWWSCCSLNMFEWNDTAVFLVSSSPWTVHRWRSWRRAAPQPEGPRSLGCLEPPAGCNPVMALASAHIESCNRCPLYQCPAPPCSKKAQQDDMIITGVKVKSNPVSFNGDDHTKTGSTDVHVFWASSTKWTELFRSSGIIQLSSPSP